MNIAILDMYNNHEHHTCTVTTLSMLKKLEFYNFTWQKASETLRIDWKKQTILTNQSLPTISLSIFSV